MRTETAQMLVEESEDADCPLTLRENYSGRGMFGNNTTGVVGANSIQELLPVIVKCAYKLGEQGELEELEDFQCDLEKLKIDSMGESCIIY